MNVLRRAVLRNRSRAERVLIVVLAVALATTLREAITPWVGSAIPWLTFFVAVHVAALFGGLAAGLLTVLLSMAVGAELFIEPRGVVGAGGSAELVSILAFALVGAMISALGAFMRQTVHETERRRLQVEREVAERRAAEEELRRAGDALRRARDAERDHAAVLSLAHIFTRDASGLILTWGPGATELYGWTTAEAVGRNADALLRTEWPRPLAEIEAALQRDGRWEGELVHYTRAGERLVVASHSALSRDEEGVRIVEVSNDVSAQRAAEETRREVEQRFRLATDAMVGLVYDADLRTGAVWRSHALRDIVGLDGTEVPPTNEWWQERAHPDDAPRVRDAAERVLAAGATSMSAEYRVRHRDGHYVWVWDHSLFELDAGGTPIRQVGCIVSIDAQVRAREALRESEARFRVVADSAPVHMWMEDERGRAVFKNRTSCEYVGAAMAAREDWSDVLHPADACAYLAEYQAARAAAQPFRAEVRVRRHDGVYRWFESIALPRHEGDRLVGYVGCSVDVHERRAAEQALRDADQRKDEFLAMLAHELRNPLGPIRNAVAVLRAIGPKDPQLVAARAMIDRQVQHMVRLIDDLLDVSRITRGLVTLQREPCLLGDLVAQAIETVRPQLDRLDHNLTVSLPDRPVPLDGDPTRLVQVLANLLHNAVKYTPAGGRIELIVERQGAEARIHVRDNGRGIPAELLPHIFDPFIQESSGLDRAQGGLGIGLTLVKRLVELHGGRVFAASSGRGAGSELTVILPIAPVAETGTAAAPVAPSAASSRLSILIVEDNPDAAESLAMLLQLEGHTVRMAGDAEAALAAVEEFVPDVALIDIGLPGMSGYALASSLRARPALRGTALMALSGYGRREDKQRALAAGFSRHFTKPVDIEVLRQAIDELSASLLEAARTLQ